MYRAPSKKRRQLRVIASYSAMSLAVLTVVTFLVLVMLGYRFNRDTSSIQQGGLVQFVSRPEGASVTIGSAKLGDTTPSKITVNPGDYDVTISRDGYLPWNKAVGVESGQVLWLNYAQLVPTTIKTDQIATYSGVAQAEASANGKYYGMLADSTKPVLNIVELDDQTPKQTELTIPSGLLPTGNTTYKIESWSDDGERLLMSARSGSRIEWLLVKRDNAAQTVNISDTYTTSIASLTFDSRSSERLILMTSTRDLRLIDTSARTLSPIIARGVTQVSRYGSDALMYIQTVSATEKAVSYYSFGSDKAREIKRITTKLPVSVASASYFGDPYIAISTGTLLDIYQLDRLPNSSNTDAISMVAVSSQTLAAAPKYLSVLSNGRFVVAQYAKGIATYDLELDRFALTTIDAGLETELRWLDRYHFYVTNKKVLTVMEFDGANSHDITTLTTNFDAVLSNDGRYIFSLTKTENGYALQRSRMILE